MSSAAVTPKLQYGMVRRASNITEETVGKEVAFLSPFQVKKLAVFFEKFFDHDHDGVIRENDIADLLKRIRIYMEWEEDNPNYVATVDLYNIFFSCMKEQVTRETSRLSLDIVPNVSKTQWLNMWGRLINQSTSILSFPSWVQLLPKHIFSIMDKDNNGHVNREELKKFYRDFFNITQNLDEIADYGYRSMTANGDYELTYDIYSMCFSNFLLGKTEYGPGKYIFGVFGHREYNETFKVDYGN